MKIKEIIKNKWGWAGAVMGYIYRLYDINTFRSIGVGGSTVSGIELGDISMFGKILNGVSKSFKTASSWDESGYLLLTLTFIIVGFILGLILQEIWRKFK